VPKSRHFFARSTTTYKASVLKNAPIIAASTVAHAIRLLMPACVWGWWWWWRVCVKRRGGGGKEGIHVCVYIQNMYMHALEIKEGFEGNER
jgi:hypothetical protein